MHAANNQTQCSINTIVRHRKTQKSRIKTKPDLNDEWEWISCSQPSKTALHSETHYLSPPSIVSSNRNLGRRPCTEKERHKHKEIGECVKNKSTKKKESRFNPRKRNCCERLGEMGEKQKESEIEEEEGWDVWKRWWIWSQRICDLRSHERLRLWNFFVRSGGCVDHREWDHSLPCKEFLLTTTRWSS